MPPKARSKIHTHLWYAKEAEEAAQVLRLHLPGFAG